MQGVQDLPQSRPRFPGGLRHARSGGHEKNRDLQNEAIAQLALETGWRADEIGPLYRWIFHELEQDAQVHDYLFILTTKHVKRMLSKRRPAGRTA